ncbi:MAG TPA: glycine--tRNA ligase subunit beta, partial [Acidobacteriaceae bacterium]
KKAGVPLDALTRVTTPKGEYVAATVHRPGLSPAAVLSAQLPAEIAALAWPKNMYWRPGKPERYVRPVKWLVALLDHAILPVDFAGVHAANLTWGHRILHGPHPITLQHPRDYLAALQKAHVLADVSARRHTIRKALDHATRTVANARWREDEPLIETVTHLTEWPSVLLGSFEPHFLTLPEEVLVTVMRDHQKYFAVEDAQGKLLPHFLAVLNTAGDDAQIIRHGNERVLRARFNDARFFWNVDQKIPLTARVELLKSVTFQKDLGTYHEKTRRTEAIALHLAQLATDRSVPVDIAALRTAAQLAKADLTSDLVKEFTELQGIVGGLYAQAQGLGDAVAQAIYWQYQPASISDPIPPTTEGQLLGLADRIGTIVDMFALGLAPTGSKDPYALRRAANAIVKILAEANLPLLLFEVVSAAESENMRAENDALGNFFRERVAFYLRDVLSFSHDVEHAVSMVSHVGGGRTHGESTISDMVARCEAVTKMRGSDDFAAIVSAFKRSSNILAQAGDMELQYLVARKIVDPALLQDPAEQSLYDAAQRLIPTVEALRQQNNYVAAIEHIATLRPYVDLFFEKVMVMVDDEPLRLNRLVLLRLITGEFSRIADFSLLTPAGN